MCVLEVNVAISLIFLCCCFSLFHSFLLCPLSFLLTQTHPLVYTIRYACGSSLGKLCCGKNPPSTLSIRSVPFSVGITARRSPTLTQRNENVSRALFMWDNCSIHIVTPWQRLQHRLRQLWNYINLRQFRKEKWERKSSVPSSRISTKARKSDKENIFSPN